MLPASETRSAPTVKVDQVRAIWDNVLTVAGSHSRKVAAVLGEATVRDVEGDTLVLLFKYASPAAMLGNYPDVLTDVLTELVGGAWKIRCEVTAVTPTIPPVAADTDASDWPAPAALPAVKTAPVTDAVRPAKTSRAMRRSSHGKRAYPATRWLDAEPVEPSPVTISSARCAVYLHYDADDVLLYVGMSVAPSLRTGTHAERSTWVDFAIRGEIVWFDSQTAAEAKEAELIRSLQPLFNIAHAVPGTDQRLAEYLAGKKRFDLLAPKVRRG
jgi:hypothetical protein